MLGGAGNDDLGGNDGLVDGVVCPALRTGPVETVYGPRAQPVLRRAELRELAAGSILVFTPSSGADMGISHAGYALPTQSIPCNRTLAL